MFAHLVCLDGHFFQCYRLFLHDDAQGLSDGRIVNALFLETEHRHLQVAVGRGFNGERTIAVGLAETYHLVGIIAAYLHDDTRQR